MKFVQMRYRERRSDWLESVVLAGISAVLLLVTKKLGKRGSFPMPIYLIPVPGIGLLLLRYWKTFSRISNLTFRKLNKHSFVLARLVGITTAFLYIAAVKDIGDRVGVTVVRYDFSEPQQGKDICDISALSDEGRNLEVPCRGT